MSTNNRDNFYSRQVKLIGNNGQELLNQARVLVIGAGGLGCPVLMYITAMGVGDIGIIDHDKVDMTNLHRQILFTPNDIGEFKSLVASQRLFAQNPNVKISIYTEKLNSTNVTNLFKKYDLIIDCSDNFETKFLVHDECYFQNKILVQASLYQYEGSLHVFNFTETDESKKNLVPCLRCLWTKEPDDGILGTCADVGVIGATAGVLGSLQAIETCKIILGQKSLQNGEGLFVDLTTHDYEKRRWSKNNDCTLCGKPSLSIKSLLDYKISLKLVTDDFQWIDLRSPEEVETFSIDRPNMISMEIKNFEISKLDMSKKYLLVCQKGFRNHQIARSLREDGHNNFFSLIDGLLELKQ